MDNILSEKQKHLTESKEALLEAEKAISEEARRLNLEFAELSPLMRTLLGAVYIRGGLYAIRSVKLPHKK